METFHCDTKIIAGRGGLGALKEEVTGTLLIVTDPYFMKNGTASRLGNLSGASRVEYFDKVAPDPSVSLAAEGAALVRQVKPRTVLALGGGSALDCAKAMAYFSGEAVKLIAVPTTSGSGSEVTDFAILTHQGVKHALVDEKLLPQVAILDGSLLDSLPKGLIADTGFDVISHAVEAYGATGASGFSDGLAQSAFCTVYAHLFASFSGDTTVRQQIHEASCMAGMAFSQAGLGLCHALAHSLGGRYHLPHGRLNAILLPEVMTFNCAAVQEKYARLARLAGQSGTSNTVAARGLISSLIKLRHRMGLPGSLKEAGIAREQLRADSQSLAKSVLEDACIKTNPVPVTGQDVRDILHRVSGYA